MLDFEKVSEQHILSVQYDPGSNILYAGFALMIVSLIAVFFGSHQRVWVAINKNLEDEFIVVVGGDSNRNLSAFERKFDRFIGNLKSSNFHIGHN